MSKVKSGTIINLNSEIEVKLTSYGVKIATDHYIKLMDGTSGNTREVIGDKLESIKFHRAIKDELWDIMNVFGHEMHNGGPDIFEGNNITVTIPR